MRELAVRFVLVPGANSLWNVVAGRRLLGQIARGGGFAPATLWRLEAAELRAIAAELERLEEHDG